MSDRSGAADAWLLSESRETSPPRGLASPASPIRNNVVSMSEGDGSTAGARCRQADINAIRDHSATDHANVRIRRTPCMLRASRGWAPSMSYTFGRTQCSQERHGVGSTSAGGNTNSARCPPCRTSIEPERDGETESAPHRRTVVGVDVFVDMRSGECSGGPLSIAKRRGREPRPR